MDFWLASCDAFDYNDEYYYSTDGVDVLGAYVSEELALKEAKALFRRNYTFLAEEIEPYELEEFIQSLGLPPLKEHTYSIPEELTDQYMEMMFNQHVSVNKMTVQES